MKNDHIKVLGKNYKLVRAPAGCGGSQLQGEASHSDLTIRVCQGPAEDQRRDTLLHEVIHCIEYGLHLDFEERQVHALACGLLCVMRDNPEMVSWLMGDSSKDFC